MYRGPPACRADFDFVEDLATGIENKEVRSKEEATRALTRCPHIQATILGTTRFILLDSGSQVSAISEDFYKEIVAKKNFSILPVSNLYVTTAIGKKTTTIKHQAYLEVEIAGMRLGYSFLIIPYLTSTVILGTDWMSRNEVILNYKNYTVEVGGSLLSNSLVRFDRGASETLICSKKDQDTFVFVINLHEIDEKSLSQSEQNAIENTTVIAATEDISEIGGKSEVFPTDVIKTNADKELRDVLVEVNKLLTGSEEKIIESNEQQITYVGSGQIKSEKGFFDDLRSVACKLTLLSDEERRIFENTLEKYRLVFSDKPGYAKGYEHRLKLTVERPNIRHTYASDRQDG